MVNWGYQQEKEEAPNKGVIFQKNLKRLDTEMSKEDHLNRIIANLSGVPISDVATGKFVDDDEQHQRVHEAVKHIEDIFFNIQNESN